MSKPLVLDGTGKTGEIPANEPLEVGNAALSASGLTAPRTYTFPDKSGPVEVRSALSSVITTTNTILSTLTLNVVKPAASITVKFPASPTEGMTVEIFFVNANTYNITLDRNGSYINGNADNYTITNRYYIKFRFFGTVDGVNIGWVVVAIGKQ